MQRLLDCPDIQACVDLYPDKPEILDDPGVNASDLKESLKNHIERISGLTYKKRKIETEIFRDVMRYCGDFPIRSEWREMYTNISNLLLTGLLWTIIIGFIISSLPVHNEFTRGFCFLVFVVQLLVFGYYRDKYRNRSEVITALHICLIHIRITKNHKVPIAETVDKILNHKL